ncbi:uncharacterized protein [Apostichopus japonicus]|uniref:uncharacterized protein n=1 Tax=Stichopus japonicus TaxID=307972 RepID=UPI003AB37650
MKLDPFHVDQLPSTTRVALIVAIPAAFIVLVLCIGLIFTYRRAQRAEQSIMEFLWIDHISNFVGARMNRPPSPEDGQPNRPMLVQVDSIVAAPEPPEEDQSPGQELQLMVLA